MHTLHCYVKNIIQQNCYSTIFYTNNVIIFLYILVHLDILKSVLITLVKNNSDHLQVYHKELNPHWVDSDRE